MSLNKEEIKREIEHQKLCLQQNREEVKLLASENQRKIQVACDLSEKMNKEIIKEEPSTKNDMELY